MGFCGYYFITSILKVSVCACLLQIGMVLRYREREMSLTMAVTSPQSVSKTSRDIIWYLLCGPRSWTGMCCYLVISLSADH